MSGQGMVERVARAMYESPGYDAIIDDDGKPKMPWKDVHPLNQEDVRVLARAAIAALSSKD